MKKGKIDKNEVAWWVYLVILVALVRLWILEQCSGRIALEGNKGSVLYTNRIILPLWNN